MATVAKIATIPSKQLPARKYDRPFFLALTLLLVVVAAIGFAPTYYLVGGPAAHLPSRIVHIHAALFTCWMLLLIVQTGLVSARKISWHRNLGIAGFLLACAMVVSIVLTGADLAMRAKGKPGAEVVLGLLSITFADACSFAVLAGFAYGLRRNSAAHKRLIIIATACIVRAAFNRWHIPILFHQFYAAYAATYIFLVLLAAYDLWTSRRIHRATLWGGAFLIFMGQMTRFIGPTASWHVFAHWVQSWGI
jgi:hypothetical protein